ncbi:fasciclin-1 isoform X2 [Neocloeon triangulifer]|uniref:fasciclin-1 isoform X2 n=1 Tax=Neocloeon triangulifer TaxID=2078957 RepID=UPI00286F4992|nr:fasciclin-1 isoform X2 [Neocloeon triangulifer]
MCRLKQCSALSMRKTILVLAVGLVLIAEPALAAPKKSVKQKLQEDPDLSQFYLLLEQNVLANFTLNFHKATFFAPTNEAFQRFKGPVNDNLILYHIASGVAQNLEKLSDTVTTSYDGSPPLWVTRMPKGSGNKKELFINNARVLEKRSNFQGVNSQNSAQVLHVIDEVLVPLMSVSPDTSVDNPDAATFLAQSESVQLGSHRVRSFRQRVNQNQKESVFKMGGGNTFFIPVDEGFKPPPRPEKIDMKVIDGHVIPNRVLFIRSTPVGEEFDTMAFTDNIRVQVSFSTQPDDKSHRAYVSSNTIVGDNSHPTGVVMAEIVHANIPVKNGVVHLIHRPLMVVDTTVTQFLQGIVSEKEDGPLNKLYEVIMDHGGEFMTQITNMKSLTLFAPSNAAWENANLNNILQTKDKVKEILRMHLVADKLPLEYILSQNIIQVESAASRKNLYFNVIRQGHNETLTVEGGGVNATVIQPNIAATNGIVHIIDRVLGIPYSTVGEKLATDPALNKTFWLGQGERFNEQLSNPFKRYTYFVPRDSAWEKAELHYPSTHKKLFMRDFQYHARSILERHLIVDQAYTMAELKDLFQHNESAIPHTVRDILHIKVKEIDKTDAEAGEAGYYLEWQGERILVSRPDVECTNGIIHVIDTPLLRDADVRVTGGVDGLAPLMSVLTLLVAATLAF